MEPIDLIVETRFHRAAPRGMGGTKAAGNYSPVLLTQLEVRLFWQGGLFHFPRFTLVHGHAVPMPWHITKLAAQTTATKPSGCPMARVAWHPSSASRLCAPPSYLQAKRQGFADVVYLDARHDRYLEEVASCNIFVVSSGVVRTPPLDGTILPGVTRRSVIALLRDRGYEVREELIDVEAACAADEAFTTGTAVVVASVGSLTYQGARPTHRALHTPICVAAMLWCFTFTWWPAASMLGSAAACFTC